MNRPREDQFTGCLIGQCLGDALGFPVEGYPSKYCSKYVSDYLRTEQTGEVSRGPFSFGQYTDDSQLARELLLSLVENQQFVPEDYARRIAAIFKEERIVGRGRATEEAARRLDAGFHWQNSGTPPPSAGNGSAMRAAPIGLFFYDDFKLLLRVAHDQGRITHSDPRCSAGAVAIAGAVALVLEQQEIDPQSFLETLSEWTGRYDNSCGLLFQQLFEWISLPPEDAVHLISKAGLGNNVQDGWQGITPFVISSVMWSLYSFLRTPFDYWETICTAIAVGGDVDTTAAMAGAVSGALNGLSAIPRELALQLNDQSEWGYNELVDLATQCYKIKC